MEAAPVTVLPAEGIFTADQLGATIRQLDAQIRALGRDFFNNGELVDSSRFAAWSAFVQEWKEFSGSSAFSIWGSDRDTLVQFVTRYNSWHRILSDIVAAGGETETGGLGKIGSTPLQQKTADELFPNLRKSISELLGGIITPVVWKILLIAGALILLLWIGRRAGVKVPRVTG